MTTARPPLVTRQQIGDIAIEVDAECGTLARTGDATTIGMMVIAMNRLQAIYEAELAAAHEQLANSAEMLPPQVRPTFSIDYKEATNDTD